MTKCPTCGGPLPVDARFCGGCGGAVASPDKMIGQLIAGRYRVVRLLGQGGMGTVYEVEQVSLKRRAALKVLKPELFDAPDVLRRFQAEAELAARLSHPNTVTLYDFGKMDDGGLFMAMELVSGRTLRAELERGALPLARALPIIRQLASSLADAHRAGIVHRDLKPDNVMLSERAGQVDFVRVLDFGIAKLRDERAGGITAMPQTQVGSLVGTPQYMSPEQIVGGQVDPRTDVYALGCLLYELVTGRLPFTGQTLPAILAQHLQDVPPPPTRVRADLGLPPAFDGLVLACLEKDPARRPPSMDHVLAWVAAIEAPLHSAAVAVPPVAPPPTRVQPPAASPPTPPPAFAPPAPTVVPMYRAPAPVRAAWLTPVAIALGLVLVGAGVITWVVLRRPGQPAKVAASAPPDATPAVVPEPGAPAAAVDPDRPLGWPASDPTPPPDPTPALAPFLAARARGTGSAAVTRPGHPAPIWRVQGAWAITTGGVRVWLPQPSPSVQIKDNFFLAVGEIAPGQVLAITGGVTPAPSGDIDALVRPGFVELANLVGGQLETVDRQPLAGVLMHHAEISGPGATFHAFFGVVGDEAVLVGIGGAETDAVEALATRWVTTGFVRPGRAPRRAPAP